MSLGAVRRFVPFTASCPWSRGGDSWIGACNISYALISDDTKVHFNAWPPTSVWKASVLPISAGCSSGLSVTCPSTSSQLPYRWVWNLSACNLKSFMFVGRISLCNDMKNSLPLFYCFTSHQVVDCILQAWSSFHPKYQAGGKVTGRTVSHSLHPPHKHTA